MRRRLFTFCSVVSLVLCVAVVTTWARSYQKHDWVRYQREQIAHDAHGERRFYRRRGFELHSLPGRLECFAYQRSLTPGVGFGPATLDWREQDRGWTFRSDADRRRPMYVGSGGAGVMFSTSETSILLINHLWVAVALLALPVAWVVLKWRTSHLPKPGQCPTCGYDLRASPDRCPECGAANPARAAISPGA